MYEKPLDLKFIKNLFEECDNNHNGTLDINEIYHVTSNIRFCVSNPRPYFFFRKFCFHDFLFNFLHLFSKTLLFGKLLKNICPYIEEELGLDFLQNH